MATISVELFDKNQSLLAKNCKEDFVDLVVNREYEEGDYFSFSFSDKDTLYYLQVDDVLGVSEIYVKGDFTYEIPFNEKKNSYNPRSFTGTCHYIKAGVSLSQRKSQYRNVSQNQNDQHKDVPYFPHASANVETRGESVFEAKNAIDGVYANLSHGDWPYASWGINRQDDALMKLEFGRTVVVDKIVLTTRSDFPHDNWWVDGKITFSDGSDISLMMQKSTKGHVFTFEPKEIDSLTIHDLIKADDPSPFPALTQIDVFGYDK